MRLSLLAFVGVAFGGCSAGTAEPSGPDLLMRDVAMMPPNACANGFTDGDETDQDCGGPACMPCDTGKACNNATDCAGGVCVNRMCAAPSCADTVKNGSESDTDCGGSCSTKCDVGKHCNDGPDCASMNCVNGVCGKSPCMNLVRDGTETDVDCGGASCDPCDDGKACNEPLDCKGMRCTNNVCKSPVMCMAGTADCDGNDANGCEQNTATDARNCGSCGRVCAANMPACQGGKCQPGTVKTVGFPMMQPDTVMAQRELLYGTRITLSAPATVLRLGVTGQAAGPRFILALYSDNGSPMNLVANTPIGTLVVGKQELPVPNTPLKQGAYWLMAVFEDSAQIAGTQGMLVPRVARTQPFKDPLPMKYDNYGNASEAQRATWMVVSE